MSKARLVRHHVLSLAVLLGAATPAGPLAAQDTTAAAPMDKAPWRTNYFPYLVGNPTIGLMLVAHLDYFRQADYFDRVPHDGIITLDGALSAQGSRSLIARLRAPQLVKGFRVAVDAGASRESRFGYLGYLPADGAPDDNSDRVHRGRYFARAEVTRRIGGPLALAAMLGVERTSWSRLPGSTAFGDDFGSGEVTETDAGGRLSLVLDTRDREIWSTMGCWRSSGSWSAAAARIAKTIPPPPGGTADGTVTSGGMSGPARERWWRRGSRHES